MSSLLVRDASPEAPGVRLSISHAPAALSRFRHRGFLVSKGPGGVELQLRQLLLQLEHRGEEVAVLLDSLQHFDALEDQ